MATKTLSVVRNRVIIRIATALLLVAALAGIVLAGFAGSQDAGTVNVSQVHFSNLVVGIVVSAVLVTAFMWFRFKLPGALAALVVLAFDVVLSIGLASWLGFTISSAILAAIVGIAFISLVNSTAFFDKLKEKGKVSADIPFAVIVDTSITAVLPRIAVTTSLVIAMGIIIPLALPSGAAHDAAVLLIGGAIVSAFSAVFLTPIKVLAFSGHKAVDKHVKVIGGTSAEEIEKDEAIAPAKTSFTVSAPVAERKLKGKRHERK
ncbi:hypothetical protein [Parasphaerochaeta coccoides]|uniref:hypothetical protein n=1 Tax=Parasphaerochaeta coccoides TaxID=273376 RepID=UPI0002F94C4E|nr:hypothetical protein [Parasphaerochaeta coccoides]